MPESPINSKAFSLCQVIERLFKQGSTVPVIISLSFIVIVDAELLDNSQMSLAKLYLLTAQYARNSNFVEIPALEISSSGVVLVLPGRVPVSLYLPSFLQ